MDYLGDWFPQLIVRPRKFQFDGWDGCFYRVFGDDLAIRYLPFEIDYAEVDSERERGAAKSAASPNGLPPPPTLLH